MEYNINIKPKDIQRFMAKIKKTSHCWVWTGGIKGGGYGTFYWNGKLHGAHRIALFFFKNLTLDTPLDAMHSCDVPSCVNPEHLTYGTRTENMRDASSKGRIVRVQDWRGELNPKAKLRPDQITEIPELFKAGHTRIEIAQYFNITSVRVGQILIAHGIRTAPQWYPRKLNKT